LTNHADGTGKAAALDFRACSSSRGHAAGKARDLNAANCQLLQALRNKRWLVEAE
jgi:hypothetical protein